MSIGFFLRNIALKKITVSAKKWKWNRPKYVLQTDPARADSVESKIVEFGEAGRMRPF
jgi:hypothetical protein